jgi:hypothetical protein
MRRISACPSAVSGPTFGSRFAIGEITNSPVTKDAAKVTSAKTTQSWPQFQLPSIIIPIPARTTTSEAGTNIRSPSTPARPANVAISPGSPPRRTTVPYIWNVNAPPSQIAAAAMWTNSRNSYQLMQTLLGG